MQPYSIDFRQKIIEVREQESISIRKLAQRFRVAKSFIQELLKQYEETGNLNLSHKEELHHQKKEKNTCLPLLRSWKITMLPH